MIIKNPELGDIPALKALWREAFGDGEDVISTFFTVAYSRNRCFTVEDEGRPVAAAYYFRCTVYGRPIAYIYAVVVAKSCRGRGVCRFLMEGIHRRLSLDGYAGAVLVPADEKLFAMYEKLGYTAQIPISETYVTEEALRAYLAEEVSAEEYARLRRKHLPEGGVVQEVESLACLSANAKLYRTHGGVACVFTENGRAVAAEVLGESIERECETGDGCVKVRTVGNTKRFALYKSFDGSDAPTYFGLAFD